MRLEVDREEVEVREGSPKKKLIRQGHEMSRIVLRYLREQTEELDLEMGDAAGASGQTIGKRGEGGNATGNDEEEG